MCQDKLVRDHVQLDIETPELFERQKSISIFVKDGTVYFILASQLNSILNMKLSLDYGLKAGLVTLEEYQSRLNDPYYRGGILQLTKDNFEQYLESDGVIVLEQDELKELLFHGFSDDEAARLYTVVENKLSYNDPISTSQLQNDLFKIHQILSRLPLFYVNFDTEVYLHMDWNFIHADFVYEGWFAKAMDFGYLIPDEFSYWKIDGRNYWKFHQLPI